MTETAIKMPLAGKRVLVTRARDQAPSLSKALEKLGAEVIDLPTIEVRDPDSWEPLDSAISRLDDFNFLILTSVNGVRFFVRRLRHCGRDAGELARLEIGAIGPATAEALRQVGVKVDFMPSQYQAEGLVNSLEGREVRGKRILIPRAKVARDLVPRALAERGAQVEVVEAYQTILPVYPPGEVRRRLTPPPDVLTFTSSSTVRHFVALAAKEDLLSSIQDSLIASIGPITSETLRQSGLRITVEARQSTIPGLTQALARHFADTSK